MSFTEKIDVLDLLINILRDHEEKLRDIVDRLEIVTETLQADPELRETIIQRDRKSYYDEPAELQSILIVDDDEALSNTFKLILQSVGFRVETAKTGLQALYKANTSHFDLVLLDMNLPDILGDEVAERIRENSKKTNIIMITGYSSLKEDLDKKQLEVEKVLMKPICPDDLVDIAKKTLKKEN